MVALKVGIFGLTFTKYVVYKTYSVLQCVITIEPNNMRHFPIFAMHFSALPILLGKRKSEYALTNTTNYKTIQ